MLRNVNWGELMRLALCLLVPLAGVVLTLNAIAAKDNAEARSLGSATLAGILLYVALLAL